MSQMDELYSSMCAAHDARVGLTSMPQPDGKGAYSGRDAVTITAQAGASKPATSLLNF